MIAQMTRAVLFAIATVAKVTRRLVLRRWIHPDLGQPRHRPLTKSETVEATLLRVPAFPLSRCPTRHDIDTEDHWDVTSGLVPSFLRAV
jgi:hypothetical protein